MKVILFGATGMVGQGVLRECLLDPDVESVLTVGRSATGQRASKLRELVHADLFDYTSVLAELTGYDACFFCLGTTSTGKSEAEYTHVTYDLTIAAAKVLAQQNPELTFVLVSGASSDSSEQGRVMWARVKGKTENAVLALPFKGYAVRPAFIEPKHGIVSRTRMYNVLYTLLRPLVPLVKLCFPRHVTTTEDLGRGMLLIAKHGAPKRLLENWDVTALLAAQAALKQPV